MNIIDENLLNNVSEQARNSERLRMNFNFHENPDDSVQRLLNALEPGTKIPVHRHMETDEMYILLKGRLRVKFYDNNSKIIDTEILNPNEGKYGVNIPSGQWHSLDVLESGTVIFEIKKGPYQSIHKDNILHLNSNV